MKQIKFHTLSNIKTRIGQCSLFCPLQSYKNYVYTLIKNTSTVILIPGVSFSARGTRSHCRMMPSGRLFTFSLITYTSCPPFFRTLWIHPVKRIVTLINAHYKQIVLVHREHIDTQNKNMKKHDH